MKVAAKDLNLNDFVTVDVDKIVGIRNAFKTKGIITYISDQLLSGNLKTKYMGVLDDNGRMNYVYLQLVEEVVKEVITPEKLRPIQLPQLKALPRTVQTQGSDPEIFIVNKENQVIPAFAFLPDKDQAKRNPYHIFWDGFQAEFNTSSGSCLDGFINSLRTNLSQLTQAAKKYDKNARLTIMPTIDIPIHLLKESKEEHVQFGCMPSLNVYGMEGSKANGRDVMFRSAGGHIHLGLTADQKKRIPEYVKALDAILGVACVSMFGAFDDPRRRELYGLAGEYRTPSHGLEYRPLSNVWMCHPTVSYIIYELARKVVSMVDSKLFHMWQYNEKDVIECINTCNIALACEIIKQNQEVFKALLSSFCYQDKDKIKVVYATFMLGVEELITKVDDIENNWFDGNSGQIASMQRLSTYKKLKEIEF